MREIKFRGKLNTKGQEHASLSEWQYFTLEEAFSHHGLWEYLDPHTIGQFTGLLDKNGKEIYEGDIFIVKSVHDGDEYIWEYGKPIPQTVTWDKVGFEFGDSTRIVYAPYGFEVIGNIYEAEQDEEEYTCPIHGKCEGGECPRC